MSCDLNPGTVDKLVVLKKIRTDNSIIRFCGQNLRAQKLRKNLRTETQGLTYLICHSEIPHEVWMEFYFCCSA